MISLHQEIKNTREAVSDNFRIAVPFADRVNEDARHIVHISAWWDGGIFVYRMQNQIERELGARTR